MRYSLKINKNKAYVYIEDNKGAFDRSEQTFDNIIDVPKKEIISKVQIFRALGFRVVIEKIK